MRHNYDYTRRLTSWHPGWLTVFGEDAPQGGGDKPTGGSMREPTNCQNEPPFPNHETAVFSLRYPYSIDHVPNQQCRTEEPHLIVNCAWFQSTPDTDRLLEIADNLCSSHAHSSDVPDNDCDGQYLRDLAARLSSSTPAHHTEGA